MRYLGTKYSPQATDKREYCLTPEVGRKPRSEMVCMGKWVPQCRLFCCIPLRFGTNEGHDYVSVGIVSEFSGWEDITGQQQRCQSSTLSPSVTTSLIEQLFQNGQKKKKSERPCVQVSTWQCRDRSEADTPPSLSTSPAPVLCQEPRDSWILLKMLCKWGVIVSPLQLLLYSKANSSSGSLRTHGWKVLGLPTHTHSLVTSLCWPGTEQACVSWLRKGDSEHICQIYGMGGGQALLRAGGATLGLEKGC